jgi:catechol 2,3-dioxygenase-like lactoylglutathione lyase family enzyme
MKPRVTVITVGVDDLEKSLRFYRDGLGLPTKAELPGQTTLNQSRSTNHASPVTRLEWQKADGEPFVV